MSTVLLIFVDAGFINFTVDNEWKELYRLSEETFVEENESLKKSGAGAGLTDND